MSSAGTRASENHLIFRGTPQNDFRGSGQPVHVGPADATVKDQVGILSRGIFRLRGRIACHWKTPGVF